MRPALFASFVALAGCGGQVLDGDATNVASLTTVTGTSCIATCYDPQAPFDNPWQRVNSSPYGFVVDGPAITTGGDNPGPAVVVIGVDQAYTGIQWFDIIPGSSYDSDYYSSLNGTDNFYECSGSTITATYYAPGHAPPIIAPPPGGTPPGGKGDPRTCSGYTVCISNAELASMKRHYTCDQPPQKCSGRFCM